jgi:hypothetical protein
MTWFRAGGLSTLPFLAGAAGVTFGGWLSDALLTRTGSANTARKLPVIAGLLGASTIIGVNYATSDTAAIAILSLAFFAQGMAALGWTIVSDIAPANLVGVTGGVFNFAANLAGIVTPIMIGLLWIGPVLFTMLWRTSVRWLCWGQLRTFSYWAMCYACSEGQSNQCVMFLFPLAHRRAFSTRPICIHYRGSYPPAPSDAGTSAPTARSLAILQILVQAAERLYGSAAEGLQQLRCCPSGPCANPLEAA